MPLPQSEKPETYKPIPTGNDEATPEDWQSKALVFFESKAWSYWLMALLMLSGILLIITPILDQMFPIPLFPPAEPYLFNASLFNASDFAFITNTTGHLATDLEVPTGIFGQVPIIYKRLLAIFLVQEVSIRMYLFNHVKGSPLEMFYLLEEENNDLVESQKRKVHWFNVVDLVATSADVVILAAAVYLPALEMLAGRCSSLRIIKSINNMIESTKDSAKAAQTSAREMPATSEQPPSCKPKMDTMAADP